MATAYARWILATQSRSTLKMQRFEPSIDLDFWGRTFSAPPRRPSLLSSLCSLLSLLCSLFSRCCSFLRSHFAPAPSICVASLLFCRFSSLCLPRGSLPSAPFSPLPSLWSLFSCFGFLPSALRGGNQPTTFFTLPLFLDRTTRGQYGVEKGWPVVTSPASEWSRV